MDVSAILTAPLDFLWTKIIPFIFVLTIVVFFHELGHYLVARWNRVRVEAFSIGFGPELAGYTAASGTRWKLCAIPLGGYVKFLGDANAASATDHAAIARMGEDEREGAFEEKAVWQRALVVAAGPIANFILAIVIYTAMFSTYPDVRLLPVVKEVQENSAAAAAGLQAGDRITAIDGEAVDSFFELQRATVQSSDRKMVYTVERDGRSLDLDVTPRMTERTDEFGNTFKSGMVGIVADPSEEFRVTTDLSLTEAFAKGVGRTWYVIESTFGFFRELIVGKQDASELRGPLGIGQITSQVATLGIVELIGLAAVLSISIGILNLFPVPMLDGGHLVFYAIEAVRGRRVSERAQEIAFRIGFACVLLLMVFSTTNDIGRFFS